MPYASIIRFDFHYHGYRGMSGIKKYRFSLKGILSKGNRMKNVQAILLLIFLMFQVLAARVNVEIPESGISMALETSMGLNAAVIDHGVNAVTESMKIFGSEYFPLNENVEFKFNSNAGETIATVEQENKGVAITYDAPNFTYQQSLYKTEKGVYLTRTKTHAFLFFGNDISYPEPVLRIPLPLKTGDTWHWEGLETEDDDTTRLTISGKAIGEEIVETAGGKFTCLRIELEVSSENGSQNTVNEWFAPGIGMVKSHAKLEGSGITYIVQKIMGLDEITFELESYGDRDSMKD